MKAKGKKHGLWKGNRVGYSGLHAWISRKKGKAEVCEKCGSDYSVQWANKSHEYKRDLDDWLELCSKCHMDYDGYKRWVGHTPNKDKQCHCGRIVKARDLCSLHYNRLNLKERGLI